MLLNLMEHGKNTMTTTNVLPKEEEDHYYDVVVIGKARHGKDTVASMLQVLDSNFTRIAHADHLKDHLAGLLSTSVRELGIDTTNKFNRKYFLSEFSTNKERYRPLLQWFGTEFVRGFDEDYWINSLTSHVNSSGEYHENTRFVITDARFPNEINRRVSAGWFVIKVTREGDAIAEATHSSETLIDTLPYHLEIKNNGSLSELFRKVEEVYGTYLG